MKTLLVLSTFTVILFLSGCTVFNTSNKEVALPNPSDFVAESTPTETVTDNISEESVSPPAPVVKEEPASPPAPAAKKNETPSERIYTVDEFVEFAFTTEAPVYIRASSVTCYRGSCSLNGGNWGISIDDESSPSFLPYDQTTEQIFVSATPDCAADAQRCHNIKNVTIEGTLKE